MRRDRWLAWTAAALLAVAAGAGCTAAREPNRAPAPAAPRAAQPQNNMMNVNMADQISQFVAGRMGNRTGANGPAGMRDGNGPTGGTRNGNPNGMAPNGTPPNGTAPDGPGGVGNGTRTNGGTAAGDNRSVDTVVFGNVAVIGIRNGGTERMGGDTNRAPGGAPDGTGVDLDPGAGRGAPGPNDGVPNRVGVDGRNGTDNRDNDLARTRNNALDEATVRAIMTRFPTIDRVLSTADAEQARTIADIAADVRNERPIDDRIMELAAIIRDLSTDPADARGGEGGAGRNGRNGTGGGGGAR